MSDHALYEGEYWPHITVSEVKRQYEILKPVRDAQERELQLAGIALEVLAGGPLANEPYRSKPNEGTRVQVARERTGTLGRLQSYPLRRDVGFDFGFEDVAVSLDRTDTLSKSDTLSISRHMWYFAGVLVGQECFPVRGVSPESVQFINRMCDELAELREREGLTILEPFTMKEKFYGVPD